MTDLCLDKADLEHAFASAERYGATYWPRSGQSTFPDGTENSVATPWARYVRRALGSRARIYGFWGEENPTSRITNMAGGHDFAVVDERYIVDGWLSTCQMSGGRTVFDLSDRDDVEIIERLYGEITNWDRDVSLEDRIDGENDWFRGRSMTGTSFFQVPEFIIDQQVETAPAYA